MSPMVGSEATLAKQDLIFDTPADLYDAKVRCKWSEEHKNTFRKYLENYRLDSNRAISDVNEDVKTKLLIDLGFPRGVLRSKNNKGDEIRPILWPRVESKWKRVLAEIPHETWLEWSMDTDSKGAGWESESEFEDQAASQDEMSDFQDAQEDPVAVPGFKEKGKGKGKELNKKGNGLRSKASVLRLDVSESEQEDRAKPIQCKTMRSSSARPPASLPIKEETSMETILNKAKAMNLQAASIPNVAATRKSVRVIAEPRRAKQSLTPKTPTPMPQKIDALKGKMKSAKHNAESHLSDFAKSVEAQRTLGLGIFQVLEAEFLVRMSEVSRSYDIVVESLMKQLEHVTVASEDSEEEGY